MIREYAQKSGDHTNQAEALLSRMSVAMEAYPPAFQGNTLNLLFLDDAQPITHGSLEF
ncbi:MAG: hypothetical protein DDT29_00452 [Dehalococcoidia bacterium]|nr:hypothetical protein [Bacillota bacterium]